MKLISTLGSTLVILAGLGLMPAAANAQFFSVEQSSDPQRLQTSLFGNQTDLNITGFDLGAIPGGFGLYENGDFLGLAPTGLVINTGQVEGLAARNCADGVNPVILGDATRPCNDRVQPTPFANDLNLNSNFVEINDNGEEIDIPDEVILKIIFDANQSGQLNLRYVFGSEAYPEFVPPAPSADDDFFQISRLNADGEQQLTRTSVGTAAFQSNLIGTDNSLQTALDGLTQPIDISIPFTIGQNQFVFRLADVGIDEGFDSTVFIQQISVESDPIESIPTPSLVFGFAWMGFLRWRDRLKQR
ncbi:choice-of-anchor L domain-containing protein [filamentous cyanobacterium LEGE 11480]|uniref:Choice-of-anchor L domain-containing protein n=1 Tax=Romeriopsis navalis LEGE 11480 TaxID=2777977 RepID=A0A928VT43_9CYAN|nr:choice-of-anchor L domain-containing protein [Romeriopsis navalis]MBE9032062.1 choice-of-anchor L domain-containing protein [Romeriopsis navalis LEGE 11480]